MNETFSFFITERTILSRLSREENKKHRINYEEKYKLIEESYRSIFATWFVKGGSFIFETLEDFLLLNLQNGIIQRFQDFSKKKLSEEDDEPQVLNLAMLSAGLVVWLGSVLIACFGFLCELIVHYINQRIAQRQCKVEAF